jgi:hypothetical protein
MCKKSGIGALCTWRLTVGSRSNGRSTHILRAADEVAASRSFSARQAHCTSRSFLAIAA